MSLPSCRRCPARSTRRSSPDWGGLGNGHTDGRLRWLGLISIWGAEHLKCRLLDMSHLLAILILKVLLFGKKIFLVRDTPFLGVMIFCYFVMTSQDFTLFRVKDVAPHDAKSGASLQPALRRQSEVLGWREITVVFTVSTDHGLSQDPGTHGHSEGIQPEGSRGYCNVSGGQISKVMQVCHVLWLATGLAAPSLETARVSLGSYDGPRHAGSWQPG